MFGDHGAIGNEADKGGLGEKTQADNEGIL